ncbi:MAG: 30S ribosomal protein S20 [Candidatus Omnitrophica bacterium]|nr:30S ribosomal protein S20 [Candidatus Omnitrophota bacterium]
MPRERSAYKEIRKAKKRHLANISTKTELKTLKKNFQKLVAEKKIDEAKKVLPLIASKINRAATKGILKKNTASRHISRLSASLSKASKA